MPGSMDPKVFKAFPPIPSPQILSRGNIALSIRKHGISFLASASAAVAPAGPAPRIMISE